MNEEEEQVEHKLEILSIDTILESCVLAEGKRWYQVKWKSSWMPEERLPKGVLADFLKEEESYEENDGRFRVSEKRSTDAGVTEYLLGRGNTWESESKLNSIDTALISSYWSQLSGLKDVVKIEEDLGDYSVDQLYPDTNDEANTDQGSSSNIASANGLDFNPASVTIKTEIDNGDYGDSVSNENNATALVSNDNNNDEMEEEEEGEDDYTCAKCNSMFISGQISGEVFLANREKAKKYSQCMKCGEMFCNICSINMGELRHNGKTTLFCDKCINNFAAHSAAVSENTQKLKQSRKQAKPTLVRIPNKKKTQSSILKLVELVEKHCEQCGKNLLGDDLVQTGDSIFQCISCFKISSQDGSSSTDGGVEVNGNKVVTVGGKHITEKGIKVLSGRHKSHVVHKDLHNKLKTDDDGDEKSLPNLDCDEVSLNMFDEEDIDVHQEDSNTDGKDEGNYKCFDCGRTFNRQYTLDTHQRIHTGEKPYVCEVCGARFRQSGTKLNHVRAVHTKERPFQCQYCGKTFSHKSSITVHIRIHTKEKPYQCQTCERCFTDRATYLKHQSIHSGVKPYHCPMCTRKFSQKSNLKRHYKNIHELGKPETNAETPKSASSSNDTSSGSGGGKSSLEPINTVELSAISTAMAEISSSPAYPIISDYSSLADNNSVVYVTQKIKVEEPDNGAMDVDVEPQPVLVMPVGMVAVLPESS